MWGEQMKLMFGFSKLSLDIGVLEFSDWQYWPTASVYLLYIHPLGLAKWPVDESSREGEVVLSSVEVGKKMIVAVLF